MTFAKRNPHELAGLIVSIIAVCPRCSARYELESDYLGKRIRCQDPQCRFVFEVADSAEPARPATSGRRAPTLDDEPEPTELEWEAPQSRGEDQPIEADWRSLPPPPVRLGVPQPEEPAVSGRAADEGTASAEEVLQLMGLAPGGGQGAAGDEEIPEVEVLTPISEGEPEPVELEEVEETEPTDYAELYAKLQRKPRRRLLLIAIPVMLVIGAVAGAGTLLLVKKRQEAAINQRAEQVYAELTAKQYRRAAEAAKDVAGKHKEAGKFRFLRDFATAMEAATDPTIPTDKRRKDFVDYLIAVRDSNDPYKDLIQEYRSHVRDAFLRIHDDEIREATRRADTQDFDTAVRLQTEAQKTQALIREYSGADESLPRDLSDRYTALVQKIEAGRKYLKFLEESQNALKTVTPGALAQVKEQAKNQGFLNRPEIVELINRSEKALLSMIVFTSEERSAEAFPIDRHPSLILGSNTDPVPANTGIVFAVARGVLYALAEGKGQIIWAARVGIDTVHLPVRVPASGNVPGVGFGDGTGSARVGGAGSRYGKGALVSTLAGSCLRTTATRRRPTHRRAVRPSGDDRRLGIARRQPVGLYEIKSAHRSGAIVATRYDASFRRRRCAKRFCPRCEPARLGRAGHVVEVVNRAGHRSWSRLAAVGTGSRGRCGRSDRPGRGHCLPDSRSE
jgi:flagellar basal body-associated protein FliL